MELQGGFLVSQIKQISRRIFDQVLLRNKVTQFNGAQGSILYVLWQKDDVPIKDIALKTNLTKTTLTSMLDNLERDGLIARTSVPGDRRKVHIVLTPKAKELQTQYDEVSKEMNEIFYAGLTPKEAAALDKTLKHVLSNLEEAEEKIKNNK